MNKKQILEAMEAQEYLHKKAMGDLRFKLKILEHEESEKSQEAYAARKDLLDNTGDWLVVNQILKVGDIIQVTGSRAGKYRKITAIQGNHVIGNVVRLGKAFSEQGVSWMVEVDKVTTQGMNKVTHIFLNGSLCAVKDLMNAGVDKWKFYNV